MIRNTGSMVSVKKRDFTNCCSYDIVAYNCDLISPIWVFLSGQPKMLISKIISNTVSHIQVVDDCVSTALEKNFFKMFDQRRLNADVQ